MIQPTIGRVLWVTREASRDKTQPEVGFVTFVHGERTVNVTGFAKTGEHFHVDNCTLVQDDTDVLTIKGDYAEWMPYQIQAAKYVNPQSGALKDTSEQKLSV